MQTEPEDYSHRLAVDGDLVIASFVLERLDELQKFLGTKSKRDEVAAFVWLGNVQEDREKTKERFLTVARTPNDVCLEDWRAKLENERKEATDRKNLLQNAVGGLSR